MCRLKKALYGLKQAPRTWYDRIDGFLKSMGFTKSKADSNLYYKVVEDEGSRADALFPRSGSVAKS